MYILFVLFESISSIERHFPYFSAYSFIEDIIAFLQFLLIYHFHISKPRFALLSFYSSSLPPCLRNLTYFIYVTFLSQCSNGNGKDTLFKKKNKISY